MTAKRQPAKKAKRKTGNARKAALAPRRAEAQPHSGLAPGMHMVNSYLAVADVGAAMEFLERAFGFARGVVLPDGAGELRYAEMRHGDSVVMLVRKGDTASPSNGAAALYTYVNDIDRVMAQAREEGAGVGEAEEKPWGDRVAVVTDPDGYRWVLATFKKLVPFS
jgi:uncharacterized glyoxalase superfamily protein PhnB